MIDMKGKKNKFPRNFLMFFILLSVIFYFMDFFPKNEDIPNVKNEI
jgi:hypothetical protein